MNKTNKKIVISVNTSWNIFNFRLNLLKQLQKEGYKVIAIAPRDTYSAELVKNNITFEELTIDNKGNNPIKDLFLIWNYYILLKKHRPQVALFFTIKPNIYGTLAAAMLNIPVINNVSGLGTAFIRENWINKIAKSLYKTSFNFSAKVFFQNVDDQKLFINNNLVKSHKTSVLPGSGVDLTKFKRTPLPEKLNILFVGRLLIDKGIVEFLDACKIIKKKYGEKVTFSLIGKLEETAKLGVSLQYLQQYTNNDIIEYLGTTDDIQKEIEKASIVILPSYREGTPRTLLEGAAMGRPIITTNVPGCKSLVKKDYNGWLCEAKSTTDLVSTIEKAILTDHKKLIEFGLNNRTFVELNYDETIVIKQYSTTIKTTS